MRVGKSVNQKSLVQQQQTVVCSVGSNKGLYHNYWGLEGG